MLATVIAPLTLVSAFLVYFGYARNRAYFGYFGITQGLLNLPLESYLLRSADVTFRAAVTLTGFALALIVLNQLFGIIRLIAPTAALVTLGIAVIAGLAATSLGLYFALGGSRPALLPPAGPPILLALGAATLARCVAIVKRDDSWSQAKLLAAFIPDKTMSFILVTAVFVAVFWAATLAATEVGSRSARADDADPTRLPLVTVFSTEFLDLPVVDDDFTEVVDGDDTHYRYSGLRLLTYADGRWFLISGRIGRDYAASVEVLPESDSLRVEIADRR